MRILIVSVFSNHLFNWVLQLKESGHELYWFDVNDATTYVKKIDFIHQTVNWKRKFDYPGRHWIKNNSPLIYGIIEKFNQNKFLDVFQQKIDEIQPDVVQSFEMHSACVPILEIMRKNQGIKWIYSAWGNDLFYYQNEPDKLKGMKAVFNRLDYMFADCTRDYLIAKKYGFIGDYLGTYPTGGGYDLNVSDSKVKEFDERNIILVKGYQHKFGRSLNILEALLEIKEEIKDLKIVVFAAKKEVINFMNQSKWVNPDNVEVRGQIGRFEVLDLMGQSLISIGNSTSDGTPNTLLEAIIMGSFPIQSNPGGATAEIIEHGKNGFLIENPEDITEIALLIKRAIQDFELLRSGIAYNTANVKPMLERNYVKDQVLKKYQLVEQNL
ncbi:glycosyltransferase [Gillisia sp. Q332]|uniref:glycosyltransferase n=1 Tax=Gillisia xinjiangensis TaxID=3384765 RepID=UPI00391B58EA